MADKRFIKTYSQGMVNIMEVWVDRETGVNYLFRASDSSGGFTVLVDPMGNPVVTPINDSYL